MDDRGWISDSLEAGFWGSFNIGERVCQKYTLYKWVANKSAVNMEWLTIKACVVYELA
jgi:hypothetical protein